MTLAPPVQVPELEQIEGHVHSEIDGLPTKLEIKALLGTWSLLAVACLLMCLAYWSARSSNGSFHFTLFWVAFSLGTLSIVISGYQKVRTPQQRTRLLVAYGLFSFIPKFFMSVGGPVYFDEYGHFRHVNDLLSNGHIFNANTYIPILQYYPGLSLLTAGVHEVTRLSPWHSGQLIIATAHCSVLVLVYVIARSLGFTSQTSFLSAMVYSLNPSYMFFDTQYGYESLGIALSFLTIVSCIKLRQGQGKASKASEKRWLITGCASACACAATHHLSSMFAVIVCVLVCLLMPLRTNLNAEQRIRLARSSWTVTLVSVAVTILWIGVFAEGTVGYIWPHISAGADQLLNLFSSKSKTDGGATFGGSNLSGSHSLFSGSEAPSYEQLAALLAPAIILVFSWLGFAALWKKRKVSSRYAIQLPMIILTATYFVSLPLALTNGGGEGAHRSWAYTYLGVALLVVMGATSSPSLTLPKILRRFVRSSGEESGRGMHARRRVAWRKRYIASMGLAVLFMIVAVGNVAAGENVDYRFPGPYRPASDTRSVTAELRQVASWANSHIRPGTKVMTDRYTSEIIEGYTDLNVPTPNDYSVYDIYLDGGVGTSLLRSSIKSDGFSYFILDNRIETESLLTKLFSIYGLKVTQAPSAFPSSGNNGFLSLVFRTPHYRIYKIDN